MKQIKSQLSKTIGGICVFLWTISLGLCLTSCSPVKPDEILNSLLPNGWVFLAHIIASIILIVILFKLVYKPASKAIQKRKDHINQQIAEASNAKKQADMALATANNLKEQAIGEATIIAANAKNKASLILQEAKAHAKEEAKQMKKQAKVQLAREEKALQKDWHGSQSF